MFNSKFTDEGIVWKSYTADPFKSAMDSMERMINIPEWEKMDDGRVFGKCEVRPQKFDFSEMDMLEILLEKDGYAYDRRARLDGEQILVYNCEGDRMFDVILHSGSYGYEDGLLEGYGEPFYQDDDEVTGELTGWDAYQLIDFWVAENDMESRMFADKED